MSLTWSFAFWELVNTEHLKVLTKRGLVLPAWYLHGEGNTVRSHDVLLSYGFKIIGESYSTLKNQGFLAVIPPEGWYVEEAGEFFQFTASDATPKLKWHQEIWTAAVPIQILLYRAD